MSGRLGTQLNRNKERQVLECSKRNERGGEESRAEKRNFVEFFLFFFFFGKIYNVQEGQIKQNRAFREIREDQY